MADAGDLSHVTGNGRPVTSSENHVTSEETGHRVHIVRVVYHNNSPPPRNNPTPATEEKSVCSKLDINDDKWSCTTCTVTPCRCSGPMNGLSSKCSSCDSFIEAQQQQTELGPVQLEYSCRCHNKDVTVIKSVCAKCASKIHDLLADILVCERQDHCKQLSVSTNSLVDPSSTDVCSNCQVVGSRILGNGNGNHVAVLPPKRTDLPPPIPKRKFITRGNHAVRTPPLPRRHHQHHRSLPPDPAPRAALSKLAHLAPLVPLDSRLPPKTRKSRLQRTRSTDSLSDSDSSLSDNSDYHINLLYKPGVIPNDYIESDDFPTSATCQNVPLDLSSIRLNDPHNIQYSNDHTTSESPNTTCSSTRDSPATTCSPINSSSSSSISVSPVSIVSVVNVSPVTHAQTIPPPSDDMTSSKCNSTSPTITNAIINSGVTTHKTGLTMHNSAQPLSESSTSTLNSSSSCEPVPVPCLKASYVTIEPGEGLLTQAVGLERNEDLVIQARTDSASSHGTNYGLPNVDTTDECDDVFEDLIDLRSPVNRADTNAIDCDQSLKEEFPISLPEIPTPTLLSFAENRMYMDGVESPDCDNACLGAVGGAYPPMGGACTPAHFDIDLLVACNEGGLSDITRTSNNGDDWPSLSQFENEVVFSDVILRGDSNNPVDKSCDSGDCGECKGQPDDGTMRCYSDPRDAMGRYGTERTVGNDVYAFPEDCRHRRTGSAGARVERNDSPPPKLPLKPSLSLNQSPPPIPARDFRSANRERQILNRPHRVSRPQTFDPTPVPRENQSTTQYTSMQVPSATNADTDTQTRSMPDIETNRTVTQLVFGAESDHVFVACVRPVSSLPSVPITQPVSSLLSVPSTQPQRKKTRPLSCLLKPKQTLNKTFKLFHKKQQKDAKGSGQQQQQQQQQHTQRELPPIPSDSRNYCVTEPAMAPGTETSTMIDRGESTHVMWPPREYGGASTNNNENQSLLPNASPPLQVAHLATGTGGNDVIVMEDIPPPLLPREPLLPPGGQIGNDHQHHQHNFIDSLIKLREVGWYWGPLSMDKAEAKLADKKDGSFLVRDSSHDSYILSLSFRSQSRTHHTRIEFFHGTFGFWSQPSSHGRMSIVEFIEKAMEHSRNGKFLYFLRPHSPGQAPSPVVLLYPISRYEKIQSLQHSCRFVILKYVRHDHVDQLPLPTSIKRYLQDKHYFAEQQDEDDDDQLQQLHLQLQAGDNAPGAGE